MNKLQKIFILMAQTTIVAMLRIMNSPLGGIKYYPAKQNNLAIFAKPRKERNIPRQGQDRLPPVDKGNDLIKLPENKKNETGFFLNKEQKFLPKPEEKNFGSWKKSTSQNLKEESESVSLTLSKKNETTLLPDSIKNSSENSSEKATVLKNWNISEKLDAILKGTILGDAHIQKRGNSYRLRIAHCPEQKSYLEWLKNNIETACGSGTCAIRQRFNSKANTTDYELTTPSNKALKPYHDASYVEDLKIVNDKPVLYYRKTVTENFINSLPKDKHLLATFYMDDGSHRSDCDASRIATHGFTLKECNLLKNYFKNTWDVETSVVLQKKEKQQYALSIPAKNGSNAKFKTIIRDVVQEIPEMEYKLNRKEK